MSMGLILFILMFLLLAIGVAHVVAARHHMGYFLDGLAAAIMVMIVVIDFSMGKVKYGLITVAVLVIWCGATIRQYRTRPRGADSDRGSNGQ